jgi:UDP-3-O-[3-hydroxymyristoyl] glucosamine N-acyltransferase
MRELPHVNPDGRVVRFWMSDLADMRDYGRRVTLGAGCSIAPYAFVEGGAEVGENTLVCHHVLVDRRAKVGALVVVGPDTVIGPGAVVHDRAQIGARVVIERGAVVPEGAVIPDDAVVSGNASAV